MRDVTDRSAGSPSEGTGPGSATTNALGRHLGPLDDVVAHLAELADGGFGPVSDRCPQLLIVKILPAGLKHPLPAGLLDYQPLADQKLDNVFQAGPEPPAADRKVQLVQALGRPRGGSREDLQGRRISADLKMRLRVSLVLRRALVLVPLEVVVDQEVVTVGVGAHPNERVGDGEEAVLVDHDKVASLD